ncbi:MAG: PmoA family protein [Thermogutta sp.]
MTAKAFHHHLRNLLTGWLCVYCMGATFIWLSAQEVQSSKKDTQSLGTVQSVAKDGACQFLVDGQPVLEYRYPPRGPKSYVSFLATPGGVNVLRDSPPDHVHHHGLMFAVGVDDVDYWAEGPTCGVQIPEVGFQSYSEKPNDSLVCRLSHALRWQTPDKNDQLFESRTISFIREPRARGASLVVWKTQLAVSKDREKVELWGRPYFGLGLRFVESMDQNGTLFNSAGKNGVEGTNNQRAQWCAYTAKVGDQPVTVVVMDHPQNPRAPATWFTMDQPFAYLSATLNLAAEKLEVTAGKPLVLTYGVAVGDGNMDVSTIENLYSLFCEYAK